MSYDPKAPLPFNVLDGATFDDYRILVQWPGKLPKTVLTIEALSPVSYRVTEYAQPRLFSRTWCYTTFSAATEALFTYLKDDDLDEPSGWTEPTPCSTNR